MRENRQKSVINFDTLDKAATCRNHPYKTHLFSEDPLVIYINSFISEDEASQLVSLRLSYAGNMSAPLVAKT